MVMTRKIISRLLFSLFCFFISFSIYSRSCDISYAQNSAPTSTNANQSTGETSRLSERVSNEPVSPPIVNVEYGYLSSKEFIITIILSVIALITLLMQFFLLRKNPKPKAEEVLRVFGVTLILIGTLIFIVAGFDSVQIAPAIGLFGTIAGYLMGRMEKKEDEK